MVKLGHRCPKYQFGPICNWDNGQVGAPVFQQPIWPNLKLGQWSSWDIGVPNTNLAQFVIGTMVKLGHQCSKYQFGPICNWDNGQVGTSAFQIPIWPNLKLGQWSCWGTSVPSTNLAQFEIGTMVMLGHQCSKYQFGPISNWDNGHVGVPVFQVPIWPNLKLG